MATCIAKCFLNLLHSDQDKEFPKAIENLLLWNDFVIIEEIERAEALENFLFKFRPESMYGYVL